MITPFVFQRMTRLTQYVFDLTRVHDKPIKSPHSGTENTCFSMGHILYMLFHGSHPIHSHWYGPSQVVRISHSKHCESNDTAGPFVLIVNGSLSFVNGTLIVTNESIPLLFKVQS